MQVMVEELLPSHDEELGAFLDALGQRSPAVLAYHYPFYRDMLKRVGVGAPFYLGARCAGELVGLLPTFMQGGSLGTVFSSLPFFGPNAGVLCDTASSTLCRAVHASLFRVLIERAQLAKALACSVYTPFLSEQSGLYDAAMPQALVVDRFNQFQLLADAMRSGALARNLRKAEAAGIDICSEPAAERIDAFYAIYQQNCKDHGIPLKPRAALDFLMTAGVRSGHARVYFAFRQGEMIAGLLVLDSPRTVSYYTPCIRPEARSLQPGVLLIDRAMRDALADGKTHWNWEGSPARDSGVYQFKKKWGALESGYRIYVVPLRDENEFRQLGPQRLAAEFPFFFVYPFDRL